MCFRLRLCLEGTNFLRSTRHRRPKIRGLGGDSTVSAKENASRRQAPLAGIGMEEKSDRGHVVGAAEVVTVAEIAAAAEVVDGAVAAGRGAIGSRVVKMIARRIFGRERAILAEQAGCATVMSEQAFNSLEQKRAAGDTGCRRRHAAQKAATTATAKAAEKART